MWISFFQRLKTISCSNVYTDWEWRIALEAGKRYFSTVEGCNIAGLCSRSSSNGIVIDNSPPIPGYVSVGTGNVKYIPQRFVIKLTEY